MNMKLLVSLVIALPLFTVACSKKEAPAQEAVETQTEISAEQQALIDSVDQPEPEAIAVEGEEDAAPAAEEAVTEDAHAEHSEAEHAAH